MLSRTQVNNSINIYTGSQFHWIPWNCVKISHKDMDLLNFIPLRSFTETNFSISIYVLLSFRKFCFKRFLLVQSNWWF